MEENKFKCTECKKYYKSYQSLWNHTKHFHTQNIPIPSSNDKNNIPILSSNIPKKNKIKKTDQTQCNFCNKVLSSYKNLHRHIQTCKKKQDIIKENEELKLKTQQQEQRILNIEQKLDNITNKMELTTTNNNTTNNNTTNNNTTNNNNGTINNNINIYNFGGEYILEKMTPQDAIKLLKNEGYEPVYVAIKYTHFSEENPEGHNMYMNNITDKYASVYDKKKNKVVLETTENAANMVIGQRINEIEELKYIYKDELNEKEILNIDNIIDNDYPQHVVNKTIKLAVKNKEMIKETLDKVVGEK
jgi:hypothetical protein